MLGDKPRGYLYLKDGFQKIKALINRLSKWQHKVMYHYQLFGYTST